MFRADVNDVNPLRPAREGVTSSCRGITSVYSPPRHRDHSAAEPQPNTWAGGWPSVVWSAVAAATAFVCHWRRGDNQQKQSFCYGCRRRNAGVSPAGPVASRRRRLSVAREVQSTVWRRQESGGAGRRHASRRGRQRSASHIGSSIASGIQKRQLRLPHSKPLSGSRIAGKSSRPEKNLRISSTGGQRRKAICSFEKLLPPDPLCSLCVSVVNTRLC
jgi:hypothetical protein